MGISALAPFHPEHDGWSDTQDAGILACSTDARLQLLAVLPIVSIKYK